MQFDTPLSLCVVNGYPKKSREALDESGVAQAHNLYIHFLEPMLPQANLDVLYVADLDVTLPAGTALDSYDGYIWTGSNLTIYHDRPEVTRQIEFSRAVYQAGVPQFGSCWGVQMAALAAGGEVKKNPRGREWSIARNIRLTAAGKEHPLYDGKPEKFDGFIMHLDEVTRIPEGGTLLATNTHTPVQALDVQHGGGTFWATQYHPEYTLYDMARLLVARRASLVKEGFFHNEGEIHTLVGKMTRLSEHPEDKVLGDELNIGVDILVDQIRQNEVVNWLRHLVIPNKQQ